MVSPPPSNRPKASSSETSDIDNGITDYTRNPCRGSLPRNAKQIGWSRDQRELWFFPWYWYILWCMSVCVQATPENKSPVGWPAISSHSCLNTSWPWSQMFPHSWSWLWTLWDISLTTCSWRKNTSSMQWAFGFQTHKTHCKKVAAAATSLPYEDGIGDPYEDHIYWWINFAGFEEMDSKSSTSCRCCVCFKCLWLWSALCKISLHDPRLAMTLLCFPSVVNPSVKTPIWCNRSSLRVENSDFPR
jgi:hypothetical protein